MIANSTSSYLKVLIIKEKWTTPDSNRQFPSCQDGVLPLDQRPDNVGETERPRERFRQLTPKPDLHFGARQPLLAVQSKY